MTTHTCVETTNNVVLPSDSFHLVKEVTIDHRNLVNDEVFTLPPVLCDSGSSGKLLTLSKGGLA